MEIITENGEHFDVPQEYTLDFEFINPILDDVGSQTAPCTLPYTLHNLSLLDYPNRMDHLKKYLIKRNVTLLENSFVKNVSQVILKANETDKIVSTFYLDEAIFYEKIKGIKLLDIKWPVRYSSVSELFTLCQDIMMLRKSDHFHIFPVTIDFDGRLKIGDINDYKEPNWLNKIEISDNKVILADRSQTTEEINGQQVVLPSGYGVTPFLKVSFIIEMIASHLGYTIEDNIFATRPVLKNLVILNNTIDAIVRGHIDYGQFVPDWSVTDFVLLLTKRWGIKFFCNEVEKKLKLIVIKEALESIPDMDLTSFLIESPQIEWSENSYLKLSAKKDIPCSETKCETYDEFITKYPITHTYNNRYDLPIPDLEHKCIYFRTENSFYVREQVQRSDGAWTSLKGYYSSFFSHNKSKSSQNIVSFDAEDEQVPVLSYQMQHTYVGTDGLKHLVYIPVVQPNIASIRHLNTYLVSSGSDDIQNGDNGDLPFMFCFQIPALQSFSKSGFKCDFPAGTTSAYDWKGSKWNEFGLNIDGPCGLSEYFWGKYNSFISHSNQLITCKMRIPLSVLQMLKMHIPKILFNQPVLIERIKCKIGNGKCEITEALFRTLRPYND